MRPPNAEARARLLFDTKVTTKCNRRRLPEMVKRVAITVGSASLPTKAQGDIKKDQGWMYPRNNGVPVRHPQRVINGTTYRDHKDTELNRRKHESNFFITINTNRCMRLAEGGDAAKATLACKKVLGEMAQQEVLCTLLKYGPKHAEYTNDKFVDVVESIEWDASVERGEKFDRLHCHIWLTLHHYSQLQVNCSMLQSKFKELYNKYAPPAEKIGRGRPYANVKLLPTSDWAEVIRSYIHKAADVSYGSKVCP